MTEDIEIIAEMIKKDDIIIFPDGREKKAYGSIIDPADDDIMLFLGESNFVYLQKNNLVTVRRTVEEQVCSEEDVVENEE